MRSEFFRLFRAGLCAMILAGTASQTLGAPAHGIAMYGDPALPPDFVSLPYANPDAPKGGRVVTGNVGGFDSLNPFILRGSPPWQLGHLTHETLLGRSWDEPFTLYGLLAESVETDEARTWVEFTLREAARFSDGSPVTVEDVIWSFETLGTQGHPRYRGFWSKVGRIAQTGPRSLRLEFTEADRELALLAGLRPILQKAQWQGRDIAEAGIEDIPIGTGPYVVENYEVNRHVTLRRNPDYWGRDLPFRRGTNNFDEIRIEFFGDDTVLKEAFKAGIISYVREFNAEAWAEEYDFPAVERGEIVKSEIPHQKPSGMTGFVMNTRRAPLGDWRVREALITAFNFEYINDTLTGGRQPRITSYFSNSELGMDHGPATGRVRELLTPFADSLPPGTLEGYSLPDGDGTARNRKGLRRAMKLLSEAGWQVENGRLVNADGTPLRLTVLLQQDGLIGQASAMMDIYARALDRLGIELRIEMTDKAQYAEREANYDFDLTMMRRSLSLSPGNEQMYYWGSDGVDDPGSRNLMGMRSQAAEAMIRTILNARDREEFVAATRALDRILTAGRYVIPIHQYSVGRIAHKAQLHYPEDALPIYGDGIGFLPEVWWFEAEE
ncbi:Nickel-binding periplasmic protein precursor [Roseovarius tolerans]|uniref:Nickel-binding periplasmic protein n=1 Tax=Roseovarius tolerans TaxID=74031 RepID=A0A0L6CXU3_9RHOB|nr:extracellular solute-binding protein [Roseovarius tolerans]KNX42505.1 Nickel-binding periplasmic protein precursor [Roseovarius tolerans]